MLSHNSQQQQPPNSNDNRSTPSNNMEQYNGGIDNRARILTTLSPSITHPNMANRLHNRSYNMPETTNTYGGNGHFTNCSYQGTQNIKHISQHTIQIIQHKR